jgi:Protein of unknown function (DUF2934)
LVTGAADLFFYMARGYNKRMLQRRRSDGFPKRDPIREAIAARAYELFVARGATDGHDLEDWLTAENELMDRRESDWTGRRITDTR